MELRERKRGLTQAIGLIGPTFGSGCATFHAHNPRPLCLLHRMSGAACRTLTHSCPCPESSADKKAVEDIIHLYRTVFRTHTQTSSGDPSGDRVGVESCFAQTCYHATSRVQVTISIHSASPITGTMRTADEMDVVFSLAMGSLLSSKMLPPHLIALPSSTLYTQPPSSKAYPFRLS